jgi:hypothetical protein
MNAMLEPPVAITLPPHTPRVPEPVRVDAPRRIGLIRAEVLARHGLADAEAEANGAGPVPRRSA